MISRASKTALAAAWTLASLLLASQAAIANPAYDHVVVVMEENHGYEQIVGSPDAPYINGTLITQGVLITNGYGEQHPSQPNYFWLFSGSNQGITYDSPYWLKTKPPRAPGPVFSAPNLYTALKQRFSHATSNFFGGYVDSGTTRPVADYYDVSKPVKNNYANRHVPWLGFTNINGGNPAGITKDFGSQFPSGPKADYSKLPKVSFVIPALNHDMHDYDDFGHEVSTPDNSAVAVRRGDYWLQQSLGGYAKWAKTHNSLLIVTFDEDSTADWPTPVKDQGGGVAGGTTNPEGLTAPNLGYHATVWTPTSSPKGESGPNHIAMVFYGDHLAKHGLYAVPGAGVNNVNLLRTIESFYHLKKSGAQTPLAKKAGMDDKAITGIFADPRKSH